MNQGDVEFDSTTLGLWSAFIRDKLRLAPSKFVEIRRTCASLIAFGRDVALTGETLGKDLVCRCQENTTWIRGTCPLRNARQEGIHAFSNGINVLLITRPERKIYLSSSRICDQGISASVLLRDEN